jgi:hypothetical protein
VHAADTRAVRDPPRTPGSSWRIWPSRARSSLFWSQGTSSTSCHILGVADHEGSACSSGCRCFHNASGATVTKRNRVERGQNKAIARRADSLTMMGFHQTGETAAGRARFRPRRRCSCGWPSHPWSRRLRSRRAWPVPALAAGPRSWRWSSGWWSSGAGSVSHGRAGRSSRVS